MSVAFVLATMNKISLKTTELNGLHVRVAGGSMWTVLKPE